MKFKVGDIVVYQGVWTQMRGTICKVIEVDRNGTYITVDMDGRTGCNVESLKLLTKLEKALL